MSNYQSVLSLAEELGVKCWTTQIYIKITGSLDLGVFLERIVWWSDKTSRTDGFFWKKAEEWGDELCVTYTQIKTMEKKLKDLGFIKTTLKRANSAPTTHYKPVMPIILNSINSIFMNPENQKTRKSENPNLDIDETSKSDFQETSKTLTGKTQERQQGEESPAPVHEDYLATVVNGQGQVSEQSAPNPDDQWFEYRDKALKAFPGDWGRTTEEKEIKKNLITGFVANNPEFNPDHWAFVIQDSIAHGVSSNNIARFIEVYPFKDYESYLANKFPRSENGRDSPRPKFKVIATPVTQEDTEEI